MTTGRSRPTAAKGTPLSTPQRKVGAKPGRIRLDVDERRAQLIELGLAEFSARPYDDISIEHIARAAGISKGLLYHYFPTKRAFYTACVRAAADQLLARLVLPAEMPPFDRLNEQIDRYLEFVRLHGGAFASLMRHHAGADRVLTATVDEARMQVLEYLTSGLKEVLPEMSASPLLRLAFQGWIGLVEAVTLTWVEGSVAKSRKAEVVTALEVRELLVRALVSTVRNAVRIETDREAK